MSGYADAKQLLNGGWRLLAFAPFTLLSADVAVALIALVVIVGAVATIRLLKLPWWWLLFPPLVQCVLSGNVQSLIVPLITSCGVFWPLTTLTLIVAGRSPSHHRRCCLGR